MQRKCKKLKLSGGQAYDLSSDLAAVITEGREIRHNLLYKAWTNKETLYKVYIYVR
jgi:hypothetical protein